MPKLSEYRKTYLRLSGKASDVSRKLAFAGIALIWIFKTDNPGGPPNITAKLILPCGFLALALFFDLLQYCTGTLVWGWFHRSQEKKKYKKYGSKAVTIDPDVDSPACLSWFQITCFVSKIFCVFISYCLILHYIYRL